MKKRSILLCWIMSIVVSMTLISYFKAQNKVFASFDKPIKNFNLDQTTKVKLDKEDMYTSSYAIEQSNAIATNLSLGIAVKSNFTIDNS